MRAALLQTDGSLRIGEVDPPRAVDGQARVEVAAAGLNPIDLIRAAAEAGGAEGPVVGAQEGVGMLDGRRVYFGSTVRPSGALADFALVAGERLVELPDEIDDATAIALGVAGQAAWLGLEWRARLRRGEHVLVLGSGGSVGLLGIQMARLLGAGRVIAGARSEAGRERGRDLGADAVVDLSGDEGEIAARITDAAAGRVDVVLDALWGAPGLAALAAASPGARVVQLGSRGWRAPLRSGAAARPAGRPPRLLLQRRADRRPARGIPPLARARGARRAGRAGPRVRVRAGRGGLGGAAPRARSEAGGAPAMNPAAPAVGWVGLGTIGLPMAARAAAGRRVLAWDPLAERREAAAAAGVEIAADVAAIAATAGDLVVCVVRTADQAEAALLGPRGALAPGGTGVVMSSVGAAAMRGLGVRAADRSLHLLDAPILGNAKGAEEGTLIVPLAGAAEPKRRARAVLDSFSALVVDVGERLGAAQVVKDVSQQRQIIGMVAAIEGLALAAGEGIDEELLLDVLRRTEPSWATENWAYAHGLWEDGDPASSLGLFAKDLGSALADGRAAGVEMPLTARVAELIGARLEGGAR